MAKLYLWASVLFFAIMSVVTVAFMINPPEQHGRGMGAALLAIYVMMAGVVSLVNLALALGVYFFMRSKAQAEASSQTPRT